MNKPRTLAEALNLVPEYMLLRLGVHKWQYGDEAKTASSDWERVQPGRLSMIGHLYTLPELSGRRPIPQEVREAMAQLIISDLPYNGVVRPFGSWLLSQGGK
jgi:hypothetical protein